MGFCVNDYFKKIGSYTGKRVLDIFFHKVRSLLLSKLIFIILQYLIYYITVIDNKTKMAARKATINEVTAADLAVDAAKIGEAGSLTKVLKLYEPPKKQAGVKIQEETVADSTMRALAMIAEAKVL